jgi:hypothetical protein
LGVIGIIDQQQQENDNLSDLTKTNGDLIGYIADS